MQEETLYDPRSRASYDIALLPKDYAYSNINHILKNDSQRGQGERVRYEKKGDDSKDRHTRDVQVWVRRVEKASRRRADARQNGSEMRRERKRMFRFAAEWEEPPGRGAIRGMRHSRERRMGG
ncbi:hypothetical protein MMC21_002409 [Puttea exsequens]|nr:hypothetical protein [Puttea exsequens]